MKVLPAIRQHLLSTVSRYVLIAHMPKPVKP